MAGTLLARADAPAFARASTGNIGGIFWRYDSSTCRIRVTGLGGLFFTDIFLRLNNCAVFWMGLVDEGYQHCVLWDECRRAVLFAFGVPLFCSPCRTG
jgi:hypothetical protein